MAGTDPEPEPDLETGPEPEREPEPEPGRRRRAPDVLTLVVGLISVATATVAILDLVPDLAGFDPRWLLAGAAVVVGLALLLGGRRRRDRADAK